MLWSLVLIVSFIITSATMAMPAVTLPDSATLTITSSLIHSSQSSQIEEKEVDVCKSRNFFDSKAEGWFWYNECFKKVKKHQYKTVPVKVEIPWEVIDTLDPEEIARLEENSRKIALMYPTKKNISEYRRLMTYIMNKVWDFTKADLVYRAGSSSYAKLTPYVGSDFRSEQWRSIRREKRGDVLKKYRDKAGLIIIYRDTCPFCEKQRTPVKIFQESWGWEVKWVNADEHPEFVRKMGTEVVPDILLVLKRGDKPVIDRVGSGLMTRSDIEDGIFYSLYRLGEVSDEDLIFK